MAIATDTVEVTGSQRVLTTLSAAAAANTSVRIVNRSGSALTIFLNDKTVAFFEIPGHGPLNYLDIVGGAAQMKIQGLCQERPLVATVTMETI